MTDPVTEARERLERLLPDVLRYDPVSMPAFDQRIDALIEAVRAEAGVSVAVEALADVRARRSTFATAEAFDSAMLEAAWNILAARSAGSGSRVEAGHCCEHAAGAHAPGMNPCLIDGCRCSRPTPPPSVDGWTFEALTGDGWAILPPPSEDFPEDDPRGDWQASGYGSAIAYRREDAERIVNALNGTPPPAVDGTRVACQRCGRPGYPAAAMDDARCTGGRPASWCQVHGFEAPPAPDLDRLRALEAALRDVLRLGHIQDDGPSLCPCKVHVAARALLADGERSDG